ncbi:MAG: winged helix-turn-helix domain-containing protein [Acidobacteria bacterium]|nr:winged helix-turn-helix domain-containing protein [Acidobacteriota bacterium]
MIFYFGPFVLKPEQYGLEVAGQPRQLQPKVFELLAFLVANRDRVVSKEELLRNIWHGAYVSEAAISRAVSEVRKVLRTGGGSADWITTVYGRGFRFVGPVIEDLAAPDGASAVPDSPPEEERRISIAVLPFADRSPQRDQAHLCEGMAEEILHRLAHVVGLRVAARGVSFQYDALADPREVGRQIGADLVLEGTVRKEGDELRIGVEVTDARTGLQVWSEQWQRHSQQVFALQDQTATLIAETLELRLAPDAPPHEARRTASSRAYDLYLRGRSLYHQARKRTYYEARRLFAEAIQLDPEYALAHAASAHCSAYLYLFHEPSAENLRLADESSSRALELAPEVAESHSARAMTLSTNGRLEEAEVHFRRALELDPLSFEANHNFARHRFSQGQMEEAVTFFFRAIEADPTSYAPCSICASALATLGRKTEATRLQQLTMARVQRRLLRYPDDQRAIYLGAVALAREGRTDEALEWAARAETLDPQDAVALYNLACIACVCGDAESGLRYLESAITHGYPHLSWIENDADLAALRADPRFEGVVAPLRGAAARAAG